MACTNHDQSQRQLLTLAQAARQAGIGVKRLRLAREVLNLTSRAIDRDRDKMHIIETTLAEARARDAYEAHGAVLGVVPKRTQLRALHPFADEDPTLL